LDKDGNVIVDLTPTEIENGVVSHTYCSKCKDEQIKLLDVEASEIEHEMNRAIRTKRKGEIEKMEDVYEKGYKSGYANGYEEGHVDGYRKGSEDVHKQRYNTLLKELGSEHTGIFEGIKKIVKMGDCKKETETE